MSNRELIEELRAVDIWDVRAEPAETTMALLHLAAAALEAQENALSEIWTECQNTGADNHIVMERMIERIEDFAAPYRPNPPQD